MRVSDEQMLKAVIAALLVTLPFASDSYIVEYAQSICSE